MSYTVNPTPRALNSNSSPGSQQDSLTFYIQISESGDLNLWLKILQLFPENSWVDKPIPPAPHDNEA